MMLPLIVFAILAPEPCAGSDLACTARDSMREASAATDPRDRAEALLTAARAHLGLYRKTGDRAELCKAQRVIPRRHTEHLGDVPRTTRAEVKAELARLGHDCKLRLQRPTPTPTTITPVSPPETTMPPPAPSGAPASAIVGDPLEPMAASPAAGTGSDALIDIGRHDTRIVRPAEGPPRPEAAPTAPPPNRYRLIVAHPGRGLLIVGGVSLFSASVLGGVATFAAVRIDRAMSTHDGLADAATGQGYTTPDIDMMRRGLEVDAPHWRQVKIGTAVAAGLVTGAAVALITVGAVKRRRSPGRLSLHPILPGLLMTARF